MNPDVLSLVAEIKARPGQEAALGLVLMDLLAPTRAEEGCLTYDLHVGREDEGFFVLTENWQSVPLWERHMEAPHLQRFRSLADELVADWTLHQLRRIG